MLAILEAARNGVRRETRKRTCQGELKGCTNSRHPWRICPQRLFGLKDKAWHFIILCRPYFIFNICRPQTSLVLPDLLKKMKNYKALKWLVEYIAIVLAKPYFYTRHIQSRSSKWGRIACCVLSHLLEPEIVHGTYLVFRTYSLDESFWSKPKKGIEKVKHMDLKVLIIKEATTSDY